MLHRLYQSVLALAARPSAPWWLATVSFVESSFFPIPPDVLLVPMALAQPRRAWALAGICTVASVLGGALGYAIGYMLFQELAKPILHLYGAMDKFEEFYANWGLRLIILKGIVPIIPYKIVTITAGAARYDFVTFLVASIFVRASRFFLIAALIRIYGETVREFIERRLALVSCLVAAGIVGGFLLLRFV